eukprot:GSChrysophyteH1.ASY1.ANO1.11.1 assembled CDS
MSSLTIADRIRAQKGVQSSNYEAQENTLLSLDQQIAALEAADSSSIASDSSESEASDFPSVRAQKSYKKAKLVEQTDDSGRIIKLTSSLATERITPLPKSLLPTSTCGSQRANAKRAKASSSNNAHSSSSNSGLEATVKELLRNYQPASAEKRPFWCRICRHQAADESTFLAHKTTELHIAAAKAELKMSYCNLCRKQFTSPIQLREHLVAKGHKAKLEKVKAGQTKRSQIAGLS